MALFATFFQYGRSNGHYLVNATNKREANKLVRKINCYTNVKSLTIAEWDKDMDYPPDDNGLEDLIPQVPNDGDWILIESGT